MAEGARICTLFVRLTPYRHRTVLWSTHGDARSQPAGHPRRAARGGQRRARGAAAAAQPVGDEPGAGATCARRPAIRCWSGPGAASCPRRARSSCASGSASSCRTARRCCARPRRSTSRSSCGRSRCGPAKASWRTSGRDLIARVGAEAPGVRLRFVQKPDKDSAPLRDGTRRSGDRRGRRDDRPGGARAGAVPRPLHRRRARGAPAEPRRGSRPPAMRPAGTSASRGGGSSKGPIDEALAAARAGTARSSRSSAASRPRWRWRAPPT